MTGWRKVAHVYSGFLRERRRVYYHVNPVCFSPRAGLPSRHRAPTHNSHINNLYTLHSIIPLHQHLILTRHHHVCIVTPPRVSYCTKSIRLSRITLCDVNTFGYKSLFRRAVLSPDYTESRVLYSERCQVRHLDWKIQTGESFEKPGCSLGR